MKLAQAFGLGMLLVSFSLVLAGGLGVPKREDVPKYLKQLKTSKSAADRATAAQMLGKRGGINANDVEVAIEPLLKTLQKDIDARVRAAAARALGDIHPKADKVVPLLIERLTKDSSMDVKMASVVALGQFGPEARDALKPLRDLAKKYDTKKAKKSKDGQTIMTTIKLISGAKKKKKA
ncbi:MAG: HEAT repeat domain-containing protein [Planctomycetes bacterium]|nr:HEAT repeat domain-containing protein [Planctomycetota bacterium]